MCGNPDSGISGDISGPKLPQCLFGTYSFFKNNPGTPIRHRRMHQRACTTLLEPRFPQEKCKLCHLVVLGTPLPSGHTHLCKNENLWNPVSPRLGHQFTNGYAVGTPIPPQQRPKTVAPNCLEPRFQADMRSLLLSQICRNPASLRTSAHCRLPKPAPRSRADTEQGQARNKKKWTRQTEPEALCGNPDSGISGDISGPKLP